MIENIMNNNKSVFEMMYGENTGKGKNNNIRKNTLHFIRIDIFMKDALNNIIKKTGRCCIIFGWQTIGKCLPNCYMLNCLLNCLYV